MPQINLAQFVGKELGVSSWLTMDQSRINQFAECSGDRQWLHVNVERAKRECPYRPRLRTVIWCSPSRLLSKWKLKSYRRVLRGMQRNTNRVGRLWRR